MLHEGWAVVSQIGLWGWIVSVIVFIVRAFPARDVLDGRVAAGWGVTVAVFFALWITGMLLA